MNSLPMHIWATYEFTTSSSLPLFDKSMKELDALSHLEDGWNFGRGKTVRDGVIGIAKAIVNHSKIYNIYPEICPTDDGDILLSFHRDSQFLDITIISASRFEASLENGIGDDYISQDIGRINTTQLKGLLSWFMNPVKKTMSEYSTLDITSVKRKNDFKTMHFNHQVMAAASQYLTITAEAKFQKMSASTFQHITLVSPEIPRYTGNLAL